MLNAFRFRMRGFSLVEALVALIVLSIGMLGIAGLHVESLRASRTALKRTEAVALASDMADRIRANRLGRNAYNKELTQTITAEVACTDTANCSPPEMAAHDLAEWQAAVAAALPNGACAVEVDPSTSPITYRITITWAEPGEEEDSSYELVMSAGI